MRFLDIPEGTDVIEVRKQINQMLSEARKSAKPTKCILCGNTQTSFCNSHSVPQLALRPIADNGMVLYASAAMGFDEEIVDIEMVSISQGHLIIYAEAVMEHFSRITRMKLI